MFKTIDSGRLHFDDMNALTNKCDFLKEYLEYVGPLKSAVSNTWPAKIKKK